MDVDVGPYYLIPDSKKLEQIENVVKCLILTKKEIDGIRKTFEDEMRNGLQEEPSSLQMENTYVQELPDGTENGKYLAVDLGGTNFRVLLVEFQNGKIKDVTVKYYDVEEELRLGSGAHLFGHMASCIAEFLKANQLTRNKISLGFTFSFPMTHQSLGSGILVSWTKSFKCDDVIGKDVVQLLNEALINNGCFNVKVNAILNDTTGTLIMGAFIDQKTSIGLILGTGSNACYVEKTERVKFRDSVEDHGKEVVVDVEWGAFGDNGVLDFIKTDFDVEVDENSLLVNSFTFEKYISGKYLGEVVRVVLVKLINEGLLFGGKLSKPLVTPHTFSTAYISNIEEDAINGTLMEIKKILEVLEVKEYTDDDIGLLQYVCRIVTNRSALLVAICLSVLIERVDRTEVTVAIDGSLYEKHPSYRFLLEKHLRQMTKKKFKFLRVSDGSGKGAALLVALYDKLKEPFKDSQ